MYQDQSLPDMVNHTKDSCAALLLYNRNNGKQAYLPVSYTHLNIPVMQPVNVSVPEVIDELRAYEPELIVVVAFGQFVTKKIREKMCIRDRYIFRSGAL